ncbi:hypothetical protein NliqN6_1808 [Naganishia liquefaciens]|uniref:F-actin-capping protein subunit alpha n=1 Tax=Naganishia liquefaciens TaxID=104408 RepID=A0A8H3YF67_9TREE|nr:hypothetical protein NliqN6_1808 [Naganishia liquefaciens]
MDSEKLRLAATLIEQSPPGQANDVLRDLQTIINDDSGSVKQYLLEHLRNYNLEHLQMISLPGSNEQSVLCEAALVPGSGASGAAERYAEPRSKKSFLYNHVTHEPSDIEEYTIPESDEVFRAALDASLMAYLKDHYASSNSAGAVFSSAAPDVPISAESTIASEDAEEEQEALKKDPSLGGNGEEGDKTPTGVSPLRGSTDTEEPSASEAIVPDNEQGDSLLEKVAESMEAVVIATEETLLGDKDASSPLEEEKSAEKSLNNDAEPLSQTTAKAESRAFDLGEEETTENDSLRPEVSTETAPSVVDTETAATERPGPAADPTYTIAIVGNKYNTKNFWTGQWRSLYTVDPKSGTINGNIHVDVHYFENGNVQLAAKEDVSLSFEVDGQNAPSAIVTAIAKNEQEYQMKLNTTYDDLGEKNFKSLRRPLPVTRQRVEWEKIAAYKAGGGQLSK